MGIENAVVAVIFKNETLGWNHISEIQRSSAFFWRATHIYLALSKAIFIVYVFRTLLLILDNSKVEILQHANKDELTGLDNRRYCLTRMHQALAEANKTQDYSVILLDCLTVWLNNEFYKSGITEATIVNDDKWNKVKQHIMDQIHQILERVYTLLIVSNDVFHDEINPTVYVSLYSRMLGELHQQIVNESNQAFAVESTIPVLMKQS